MSDSTFNILSFDGGELEGFKYKIIRKNTK